MPHQSQSSGHRRNPKRGNRFCPNTMRLEERALMTTVSADLPVGVAAESGIVFFSHFDPSDPGTNREDIGAFSATGAARQTS